MMKTEKEVQKQVIETFKSMGYAYLGDLTKSDNENINKESLKAWLVKNQKINDERWHKIEQKIHNALKNDLYEANQKFYDLLIYGVDTKISQNENTQKTWLIDWKDVFKNEFGVAEEVSVKWSNTKRPDVVLYVNGIALGVLELKKSSVSVESAIRQNLDNQKKEFIRDFFKTIQLVMAGNESQGLRYGVIETKEKHYLSWKEEGVQKNLFETIECFLEKERFLEFIHDFLIFDKGQKKCARFHQYFAVKKTQEFIHKKEGGIIWHTQGSGKSLTMVWLVKWLRKNIKQARILIVTDRRELDAQIQGVFEGIGEPIYRADSKKDLLSVLFENKEFLVGSLVHKFDDNDLEDLKKQPVLKECLNQGVALDEEALKKAFAKFKKQGNMDYFIHKNALGFLTEQLDLYLFEYLFKEMTEFDDKRFNEINTIKEVALQVISLVSEFENELCKIWNKPRFVLNSHFIVSLDQLKAKNYDLNKITNHKNYPKQVKEWQDLNLKTTDNLLENEFLPLDTLYFKDLEEEIKSLFSEDEINGTLIKSENYQALNSLKNRYKETIDCIYIDPPYNTQNNEFMYADNFKRSSWLSMMENRLELAHRLLNDKGVMFVSIDDNEQAYCKVLMDEVFNGGG
ncbi:hypothetical protein VN0480_05760 [Helicobacter pylori]